MGTRGTILILAFWMGMLVGCGAGGGAGPVDQTPRETLLEVSPLEGSTAGGTVVTLRGSGFLQPEFENLTVYFGEEAALDVQVVDDRTITCVVPAGRLGPVAVNVFGDDQQYPVLAGGFVYVADVAFVADGPAALNPGLHRLDLDAGAVRLVGPIGYPIGALARMPDGRLFGAEPVDPFRLIEIDPGSGQGTARAVLRDAITADPVEVTDMAASEGRLLARTATGALVEIDPATGLALVLARYTALEAGRALGADEGGRVFVSPGMASLQFRMWDVAAGLTPFGLDVDAVSGGVLGCMTVRNGRIHALQLPGRASTHVDVLRIDPVTGETVLVTALPSSVGAIAGDF